MVNSGKNLFIRGVPGAEGNITVKYDTNRMGNFHKTVTVNSNAKNKTVVLTIKGQVMNPQHRAECFGEHRKIERR